MGAELDLCRPQYTVLVFIYKTWLYVDYSFKMYKIALSSSAVQYNIINDRKFTDVINNKKLALSSESGVYSIINGKKYNNSLC